MQTIADVIAKYSSQVDCLDIELIIAHTIKKSREFVLTHPEYKFTRNQKIKIENKIKQRIKEKPLAYILGNKEFFGLNFKVNRYTLIPRPETELLVEQAIKFIKTLQKKDIKINVIDIGIGSGNILITIAKQLEKQCFKNINYELFGIDISSKALLVAKYNSQKHRVKKKIKFFKNNLLLPIIKNKIDAHNSIFLVLANLPYLSKKIYNTSSNAIKKYEPRSALYSPKMGLSHYEKLFQQLKKLRSVYPSARIVCYLEISPEQKSSFKKMIKKIFPFAKIFFRKDLAQKYRIVAIKI